MSKQVLETDVLVIGSGLAGLYAAFCAVSYGSKVALVTRTTLKESNSYWAQGGIAAAVDSEDSTVLHRDDTLKAGCGLCVGEAVEILVCEGRERVIEIAEFGMEFDSGRSGFDLGLEGGHSKRRVLHAGGAATGKKMVEFLISSVEKKSEFALFEGTEVEGLISSGDCCFGAWTVGPDSAPGAVLARSTVLATGGAAALFGRTTNPQAAKGEGVRMAYEAGAEIMDMEFVQFHPTAFYSADGNCFLISEALRGEGARLVDENGEGLMAGHPLGDLAPRDAVSKAIQSRISGPGRDFVYLDLAGISPEVVKNRFGDIYRKCLKNGVDCLSEPIPVAPAAHYTIGGVKSGLGGETSLKGLYCCGEAACAGVHGANRLASNSLLECLVFSRRAAQSAAENSASLARDLPPRPPSRSAGGDAGRYSELMAEIMSKTDSRLGIVREAAEMKALISDLENALGEAEDIAGWRGGRIAAMATVCLMMARAALVREETRGVHMRRDFPRTDPELCKHSIFSRNSGGLNPRLEAL